MSIWSVSHRSRLGDFLKEKLASTYSKRQIKNLLERNCCKVNGQVERFASATIGVGDRVELKIEVNPIPKLEVIFEDEYLIVYNKPAGITSEKISNTLVHRLDKDTSGVFVVTKTKEAFEKLYEQFRTRKVQKHYLAIVDGTIEKSGEVNNTLGVLKEYQGQSIWGKVPGGKKAITKWKRESLGKKASLVSCFPKTGRTHQIRVHMASLGNPILGDYQYGQLFRCEYHAPRIMLHAYHIKFNHPVTNCDVDFEAPFPQDFQKVIQELIE